MGLHDLQRGLDALRRALVEVLDSGFDSLDPLPLTTYDGPLRRPARAPDLPWLLAQTSQSAAPATTSAGHHDDSAFATSSVQDEAEGSRLIALVELARGGDSEAFGQLYDHYQASVYRFLYYRVGSVPLAEDLTAETFFRALRSMSSFRWQGKDFGAWLMTIARNLTTDHFKAGRTRLESTTEDMSTLDSTAEGPEGAVLASLTNEALLEALSQLPTEQRECLVMRFLQGLSIAETADVLGRSSGAVKQLQLRGVRNLAKILPEGMR
ncbi:sigma-70 family RNA polymerase sigma factor [Marmoricola sp. URHB0036]|uniref:sigma-70 family RNA polymerase sigma factor n=1 Tax=Marmoricola sp. URHB0036 TaxID=1298863 RepID=UPI000403F3D2|nr:sigma-70 family RNA polymerase sigma factor [Marmoricola sp. URHB0036]